MQTAEALADIEAIKQLKAKYFRCMDTKDWSGFRNLFTPDAVFDVRGALEPPRPNATYDEPPVVGIEAIVNEASGVWAMSDILIPSAGVPFGQFRGFGHYHETYRKVSGEWRIATLRLTRLLVQTE
jgi:hypothetical protein